MSEFRTASRFAYEFKTTFPFALCEASTFAQADLYGLQEGHEACAICRKVAGLTWMEDVDFDNAKDLREKRGKSPVFRKVEMQGVRLGGSACSAGAFRAELRSATLSCRDLTLRSGIVSPFSENDAKLR